MAAVRDVPPPPVAAPRTGGLELGLPFLRLVADILEGSPWDDCDSLTLRGASGGELKGMGSFLSCVAQSPLLLLPLLPTLPVLRLEIWDVGATLDMPMPLPRVLLLLFVRLEEFEEFEEEDPPMPMPMVGAALS